jgi:hypothetical protein
MSEFKQIPFSESVGKTVQGVTHGNNQMVVVFIDKTYACSVAYTPDHCSWGALCEDLKAADMPLGDILKDAGVNA